MDKMGGLEYECVWRVCVCMGGWVGVEGGGGMGEGDNFDIRKTCIGCIYTSFCVVPKRTIAYEAP